MTQSPDLQKLRELATAVEETRDKPALTQMHGHAVNNLMRECSPDVILQLIDLAQAQETVGEDELRPASQKLASMLALKHGFILPEVADYDEMTKAILTAARRKV